MNILDMPLLPVHGDYERYMTLLLDADPSRELVECYLRRGQLWACEDANGPVCVALMMPVGEGAIELMNLSTRENMRRRGIARAMVTEMKRYYAPRFYEMRVGTAYGFDDVQNFYEGCGFEPTGIDKGFFVRNYKEPIFDGGKQCVDMIRYALKLK